MADIYPSMDEALAANSGRAATDEAMIRFRYEYGLFARRRFREVVIYGRVLGLDIVDFPVGGPALTSVGWLVVGGQWDRVSQFLNYFDRRLET